MSKPIPKPRFKRLLSRFCWRDLWSYSGSTYFSSLPNDRNDCYEWRGAIPSVSPGLMVFGLALAVLIGVISGAVPAYRASKMKPVDALRYE
ncbi:MAG: ABC transporter permease [Methanosarcina sp.]